MKKNPQEVPQNSERVIIVLIIVTIISLLIFLILAYRLGKIGYGENKQVNANLAEDISIKITQGDIDIDKNTKLEIFKNQKFEGKEMIAPQSKGEYQFSIKNESSNNLIYHMKFSDEKNDEINMKYKLKIDNIYIKGNEKEYVGIEELDLENIIVLSNSKNIYTLEWYWEDDDDVDTIIGSQKVTQYYTLNLQINASLNNKTRSDIISLRQGVNVITHRITDDGDMAVGALVGKAIEETQYFLK